MKEEEFDQLLKKTIQQIPEDSPSERFVEMVMYKIERQNIFVRILDWIVEKQSKLTLKLTLYIIESFNEMITDYKKRIEIPISI